MRIRIPIVGAVLVAATSMVAIAQQQPQGAPHPKPKFTLTGETALLTVAIRADKTADFEQVMSKMRNALLNSPDPKRREQAAGWKVMKLEKPLPDGNVGYVHMIDPVIADADYAVMQTLYEAFPDERQSLYDLYRGAFVQNLSLATGRVVLDMAAQP